MEKIHANRKESNEDFFNNIDSEIKAYLLGFFIADGCITDLNTIKNKSYRLQISLSEKDLEIVELYKKFIAPNNNVITSNYRKGAKNRLPVKTLKWTSNNMGKILISKYNVKPRKTFDINFIFNFDNIPNNLQRHFIRGFFDGDGSISIRENDRIARIVFYATSKPFLEQISSIIESNIETLGKYSEKKTLSVTLYELRFFANQNYKKFVKELYNYFYKDSNYYLSRKKLKFENYLNTVLNIDFKESVSV